MPRFIGGTFVAQVPLSQKNRPVFVLSSEFASRSSLPDDADQLECKLDNVENIHKLIGRKVISLETANRLGRVGDVLVDTLSGQLAGISVRRPDTTIALASILDIHSIGPDAVIVEHDQSLVLREASPLNTLPKAKQDLIGVKVISHHGQNLGGISNLFLCIDRRPVFIYEVRASFFDALLGRASYFLASLGCARSDDGASLIINAEPHEMHDHLEDAAAPVVGPYAAGIHRPGGVRVEVRTHAE